MNARAHGLLFMLLVCPASAFGRGSTEPSQQAARQLDVRAENLRFEISEGGIITVTYDLVSANPQLLVGIRLLASRDDGTTFDLTATSVKGDVGVAVLPGPGKQIVWEAARDAERLEPARLRLRIVVVVATAPSNPPSYWGVVGAFVPAWDIPQGFGRQLFDFRTDAFQVAGAEFRVGFMRGRRDSGDWGVSFVRRRLKPGSFVVRTLDGFAGITTSTYRVAQARWQTGVEAHTFVPLLRLGHRTQLGVAVAAGLSGPPEGAVEQRVEGTLQNEQGTVVSVGPAFIHDDQGHLHSVAPGQTFALVDAPGREVYRLRGWDASVQLLGRAEMAAAFAVRPHTKLRISGGFNFPGAHVFSVEITRTFGVPPAR